MKRFILFVIGVLAATSLYASIDGDTLALTLPEAEAQFRQHNLQLMATRLGISESQAYEYQAKVWNNPSIYIEQMPYNQQTKEVMPLAQRNSEQVVQLQQLLLLAGKRNKQLAIARTATDISADRFYDLLRTLNYQLRSTFYDLYLMKGQKLGSSVPGCNFGSPNSNYPHPYSRCKVPKQPSMMPSKCILTAINARSNLSLF